jgi:hypothetical protein
MSTGSPGLSPVCSEPRDSVAKIELHSSTVSSCRSRGAGWNGLRDDHRPPDLSGGVGPASGTPGEPAFSGRESSWEPQALWLKPPSVSKSPPGSRFSLLPSAVPWAAADGSFWGRGLRLFKLSTRASLTGGSVWSLQEAGPTLPGRCRPTSWAVPCDRATGLFSLVGTPSLELQDQDVHRGISLS